MRWGLAQGLGLAAVVALLVSIALAAGAEPRRGAPPISVPRLLGWYLAVGGIGGVILGLARPRLRTAGGSAVVGAGVGALALASLMQLGGPQARDPVVGAVATALGALNGALLGWWFRRRAAAYGGWQRS